jgi:putative acetyltransferase
MKIRSENAEDYAAIAQVHQLAFGQGGEAKLVDAIRASDRFLPQLSLVAEVDGQIVGHILFSYIDLVAEDKVAEDKVAEDKVADDWIANRTCWQVLGLAPLAVHPAFQRQGIGSGLVQAGLTIADTLNELLVVVLGHSEFYPRFGFAPSTHYGIVSPFPVREAVFMVKPLTAYQAECRGKVVYPAMFDGL